MTPPIRMVSVPVDPLWMMHVLGPDDIYPAPDHATAVEWCAYLNREIAPKVPDVWCIGVPAIWTGTAEEHAEGLPEAIKGWTVSAVPAREPEDGAVEAMRRDMAAIGHAVRMLTDEIGRIPEQGRDPVTINNLEYYASQIAEWSGRYAALTPKEATACRTCGGKGYTEHEGGDGEGHPSRPEIEDCPSCHKESPADHSSDLRNMVRPPAATGSGDAIDRLTQQAANASQNHKTMFVYVADLRAALSALRAQPQAREEAQGALR